MGMGGHGGHGEVSTPHFERIRCIEELLCFNVPRSSLGTGVDRKSGPHIIVLNIETSIQTSNSIHTALFLCHDSTLFCPSEELYRFKAQAFLA